MNIKVAAFTVSEKSNNIYVCISAKLKSRNSQGQCFTNLAFAYSQLGNIDDADVAFNHALLASKDSGKYLIYWIVASLVLKF